MATVRGKDTIDATVLPFELQRPIICRLETSKTKMVLGEDYQGHHLDQI